MTSDHSSNTGITLLFSRSLWVLLSPLDIVSGDWTSGLKFLSTDGVAKEDRDLNPGLSGWHSDILPTLLNLHESYSCIIMQKAYCLFVFPFFPKTILHIHFFTFLASWNQFCIAAHLLGQFFLALSSSVHWMWATSLDSFCGMSSRTKYMSVSFSLLMKFSSAVSLLVVFPTCLAISKT